MPDVTTKPGITDFTLYKKRAESYSTSFHAMQEKEAGMEPRGGDKEVKQILWLLYYNWTKNMNKIKLKSVLVKACCSQIHPAMHYAGPGSLRRVKFAEIDVYREMCIDYTMSLSNTKWVITMNLEIGKI